MVVAKSDRINYNEFISCLCADEDASSTFQFVSRERLAEDRANIVSPRHAEALVCSVLKAGL